MPTKLFQFSTITSLMYGNFDGEIAFKDFVKKGNFGLGTFDALDGEMIAFDGNFYQLLSNGTVNLVDESYTSPFLSICNFKSEKREKIINKKQFELLNKYQNFDKNSKIIAIKIVGKFKSINLRTVNKQTKPYKPLFEIKNVQGEKVFSDVEGIIVGFYTPKYLNTIGVEGIHFHFITKDLKNGGHVLNFELETGILEESYISEIELKLTDKTFSQEDIQVEIKKLEGFDE